MDVDGAIRAAWEAARNEALPEVGVMATGSAPRMTGDFELPKGMLDECIRLCKPEKYTGSQNVEIIEAFVRGLKSFLEFHPLTEPGKVFVSACFLDGEAREWWDFLRGGQQLPSEIQNFDKFIKALSDRFMPRAAREQATAELRKLKQGKLSIERYIEKFQALCRKAHQLDPALVYQWFIAGLATGERQAVTGWAADKEMSQQPVGLEEMMNFLRIKDRKNATETALGEKGMSLSCENHLEPMDIGAVTAHQVSQPGRNQRGQTKGASKGQPQNRQETRTCHFCGIPGHLQKDCRHMQKAKELWEEYRKQQQKQAPFHKKVSQENHGAPTQEATQWRGPQSEESQQTTHQGSNQQ